MKFGFAARLSWVLALAGCLTAGLTGLYVYRSSHDMLVQNAKEELSSTAKMMSRRIDSLHQDIIKDLHLLTNHPVSREFLQQEKPDAENTLSTLFELLIVNNPAYLQIRLISAKEYGLEKVRVDRDKLGSVRVTGDNLQEKGYFPYVSDTLKMLRGSTYLSPIVINHERGAHAGLNQPTAIFATPVVDAANQTIGVIVINLDLKNAFDTLASDLPKTFQLFLANQQGDFLIHPNLSETFGFDRGQRILMQDEFPATAALVERKTPEITVMSHTGAYANAPLVTVFIRDTDRDVYGANTLLLGVGQPMQQVLAKADELGEKIILIIGGVGIAGILLAVALARYVTKPINKLNNTIQRFSVDQDIGDLPTQRQDELGQLARNFLVMHNQIRQQFAELQQSHEAMVNLAQHDALTGLPNRRLFLDRLENAIVRARRSSQPLALLFIDLDKFKDINDRFGHEAGDAVLQSVAKRLSATVRETDTVARLGGDEFVVLLENIDSGEKVAEVASKLCDNIYEPLPYANQILHISMSVGVSLYPQDGETLDQLMNNADRAMYQAKAESTQRVRFATSPTLVSATISEK
jgi:diguanylate cyclase (GGDEF)-like protein